MKLTMGRNTIIIYQVENKIYFPLRAIHKHLEGYIFKGLVTLEAFF